MKIEPSQIKELRKLTGAGVMECKKVLEETSGDMEKAKVLLQEIANKLAQKKADKEIKAGVVDAYIHGNGNIGVLVEVHCETDFLAMNKEFRSLVREIALQIASEAPKYISGGDIPIEEVQEIEREAEVSARTLGKPENAIQSIKSGKVRKHVSKVCLMEQRFIKNPSVTIADIVQAFAANCGEKIKVVNFSRFQIPT